MIIRYGKGRVGKVTNPGEMITFSKSGALKMNSAEIDDTVLTVIFSQNAFYNEGGFSNGLELTNTTTAEVAGIIAMSGSGTGEAMVVVSWITHPVLGDLLTLTYDGLDGIKDANDVDMEAQTIPCHNVLNEAPVNTSPPVISGTTYEGSVLSCNPGAWNNGVSTFGFDWQRDGVSTGQSSNNYLVELDDAGASMTCVVTATNAIGANVATSNTLVMDGGVVPAPNVTTHNPDYLGADGLSVSAIVPVIDFMQTSDSAPCVIQCSAYNSVITGTTEAGLPARITHAECSWKCYDGNGNIVTDHINNGLGTYMPISDTYMNDYKEQVNPLVRFPVYDLDPQTYTVVLSVRAPNGSGGFTTAVTSSTFEVTDSWTTKYGIHQWIDADKGLDTNEGFDAWGLTYSGGTYAGGVVTAAGGFTDFNPIADSVNPIHRDNYLWIDGALRRVEKIDNNSVSVYPEDQAGIAASGLSSVPENGPYETYNARGKVVATPPTFYHLNGNAGASVYTQTIDRMGQSLYWDGIGIVGYNGDPANSNRVEIVPDGSFPTQSMVFTEFEGDSYVSNVNLNCNELATQSCYGAADASNLTDYRAIYDNVEAKAGLGITVFHLTDTLTGMAGEARDANCGIVIIGGRIDNKYTAAVTDKTNTLYTNGGNQVWVSARGIELTGDCNDDTRDHYYYQQGHSHRSEATALYGHDDNPDTMMGFIVNANCGGTIGGGSQDFLELACITDNYGSECRNGFDLSGSNNAVTDSWYINGLMARNYAQTGQESILYSNCQHLVALDNINDVKSKTKPDPAHFVLNQNAAAMTIVAQRNESNGTRHLVLPSGFDVAGSSIESANNKQGRFDNETGVESIVTAGMGADYIFRDTLFSNIGALIHDYTAGNSADVPTTNTRIDNAGGEGSLVDVTPDWQDGANSNFLPVGFESLAPTVNIQPEATISVEDGKYMAISADFDQATSHQWYADGVPITGETKPVLVIKVVTADDGTVYTIEGTNAVDTTASTGCALTIGGGQELTLNGVDGYMSIASTPLSDGDTAEITFNSVGIGVDDNVIFDNITATSRLRLFIAANSSIAFVPADIDVTIDGNIVANGQNIASYFDGVDHVIKTTLKAGITRNLGLIGQDYLESKPYGAGVLKNLKLVIGGDTTQWNINSGGTSGQTEAASIGAGDITFNNVDAGDWSE